MPVDATRVGQVAAGAMEYLEREYADEQAELLDVAMVLAVRVKRGEELWTNTHVEVGEGTSVPAYVQVGLLHAAIDAVLDGDEEDEE
jgi:hypothetical protein